MFNLTLFCTFRFSREGDSVLLPQSRPSYLTPLHPESIVKNNFLCGMSPLGRSRSWRKSGHSAWFSWCKPLHIGWPIHFRESYSGHNWHYYWLDDHWTSRDITSLNEVVLIVQTKEDPLQSSLKQLWEIERVPETSKYSSEDELALQHFEDSYINQPNGRYSVLPRREKPPSLGTSRNCYEAFHSKWAFTSIKRKIRSLQRSDGEYMTLNHAAK